MVFLIGSIVQYKKLKPEMLENYDAIIMSYNLLTNKNFITYINDEDVCSFNLFYYNWGRLILDEAHEYLCSLNKIDIREIKGKLFEINCDYKWLSNRNTLCNLSRLLGYDDFYYRFQLLYKF